jgi:hypothetical protein
MRQQQMTNGDKTSNADTPVFPFQKSNRQIWENARPVVYLSSLNE